MSAILVRDGAVLTESGWLEPGYVMVRGVKVAEVGAGEPPPEMVGQAQEVISALHMAVLPGLVNGHTHFSQTFMRGLAGGRPLLAWLKELIWPMQRAMSPEELYLAALLGLVENLRCGATTVVDHHKVTYTPAHTDAVCRAAETVGLRLTLARAWADRGAGSESPADILADLTRLFEIWHDSPYVSIANGPLVPWRCSAQTLQQADKLMQQYGAPTHLHVSETREEVRMTLEETGLRPVTWLDSLGVLGPDIQIVHGVWLDEDEIDLLAACGALVVHCPVSNAVLGSGSAPVASLRAAGVRVRLGTDGPASNDTQDMFETVKMALGLARVSRRDPAGLAPAGALAMALDCRVLAPGAPADLIVVNLNHVRAMPIHDIDSALALCTHGSDVDTVMVNGRLLMQGGRVLALDEAALLDECRAAAEKLRKRVTVS